MQDSFFSKAKESASVLKEKIADFKDDLWGDEQKLIISEFKDGSMDKLRETLQGMTDSGLVFIKTGYELKSININMGIPPVIGMSFKYMNKITSEERSLIQEEIKDKKILKIVVSCLLKAEDFYDSVKIGEYKLDTVNITLGLVPGVSVVFAKQK